MLVGGGLFLGLNNGAKLLMGVIYHGYNKNVWFEHIFRVLRYSIVVFLVIGVYPLLFAQTEKLWKKFGWIKSESLSENAEQSEEISDSEN